MKEMIKLIGKRHKIELSKTKGMADLKGNFFATFLK